MDNHDKFKIKFQKEIDNITKYFDTEYLIELFGDDLELIRDDLPDYRIKELQSRIDKGDFGGPSGGGGGFSGHGGYGSSTERGGALHG